MLLSRERLIRNGGGMRGRQMFGFRHRDFVEEPLHLLTGPFGSSWRRDLRRRGRLRCRLVESEIADLGNLLGNVHLAQRAAKWVHLAPHR
jgi:hypothetical protein